MVLRSTSTFRRSTNRVRGTARRFREEFGGLDPERFADMLALMGDSSDNVPGVKGLGLKSALPLLLQFGSVEALLDRVDEARALSRASLRCKHNVH